jgi:hypothetical protein
MHIGIISFCDRVSYNIKSNDIKSIILQELENKFNIKIINKHYYKFNEQSISHIKATPHLITVRTNGNPYYMYFTKYEDVEIIYFIDKKVHPTYHQPRIIIGRGLFDIELFKGTLIDGEMVRTESNKWIFLTNDLIAYQGTYLINKQLPDRINILYDLFENKYTPDDVMDVCNYFIKSFYNLCCDSILKLPEFPYTIRGIYFVAYNLKYKPKLLNYNEDIIKNVVITTKEITEFKLKNITIDQNVVEKQVIQQQSLNSKQFVFLLSKTDNPDVYNVYDNDEYKGIACIQSIHMSHFIRNFFKNKSITISIQFNCIFNKLFNKWEPTKCPV